MKFYLQINGDNIITDAIEYPYKDYLEIECDSLPYGVISGWWKWENNTFVEYPELKPIKQEDPEVMSAKIIELQQALDALTSILLEVIG